MIIEIKFRAKKDDPADFSFVYGELAYTYDGRPRILTDRHRWLWTTCVKGTEGQFTGLKDKNGNEIWRGDIIRMAPATKPALVLWNQKYASFALDREGWAFNHFFGEAVDSDKCEVIGNIYENPELLK